MSAKIKVPKGWRRVRQGEIRKYGDKVWDLIPAIITR